MSGILVGGVYALIAVSLALVFGVMRVLNFAHGDLLMIATYGVALLHQRYGMPPYVASIVMAPVMALLGAVMFRFIIRPVLGASPLMQAQLTIGVSFVIQSAVLMWFGADLYSRQHAVRRQGLSSVAGIVVGAPQLVGFVISLAVCALLTAFLTMTDIGHRIRATAQDPSMAWLCGINVGRTQMFVFVGCIAILAIPAGCLMTYSYVTPSSGLKLSLLSLLVVVLGGLGDLRRRVRGRPHHRADRGARKCLDQQSGSPVADLSGLRGGVALPAERSVWAREQRMTGFARRIDNQTWICIALIALLSEYRSLWPGPTRSQ